MVVVDGIQLKGLSPPKGVYGVKLQSEVRHNTVHVCAQPQVKLPILGQSNQCLKPQLGATRLGQVLQKFIALCSQACHPSHSPQHMAHSMYFPRVVPGKPEG